MVINGNETGDFELNNGGRWGMFTSFYQARKIAVTLLYKLKTADLSCFDPEEKSLSKWQKMAI